MKKVCEQCKSVNKADASFCRNCGLPFVAEEDYIIWVNGALQGNQDAITYLYELTNRKYRTICKNILYKKFTSDEIDDVLQESYIKIFKSLYQLKEPEKFIGWGSVIVKNTSINYYNRTRPMTSKEEKTEVLDSKQYSPDQVDITTEMNPEELLDKKETVRLINEMIEQLPEEQRLCIYLFYMQGMTVKEIAEQMDVSDNTVKSRLKYGRNNIENQVLLLEKKGTKLYGLAPLPFFIWLYKAYLVQEEASVVVTSTIEKAIVNQISETITGKPGNGKGSFSADQIYKNKGTISKATAKIGASAIGKQVSVGLIIAATTVGVVTVGVGTRKEDSKNFQTEEIVEELTEELTEEIMTEVLMTETETETAEEYIETVDYEEASQRLFAEYQAICNEETLPEDWETKYPNVSPVFWCALWMGMENYDVYYYTYYDINKDGMPELITSHYLDTESNFVDAVYTYDGNEWKKIKTTAYRGGLKIFEDGTMYFCQSGGSASHYYESSRIAEDGCSLEVYKEFVVNGMCDDEGNPYAEIISGSEIETLSIEEYEVYMENYMSKYTEVDIYNLEWKPMF